MSLSHWFKLPVVTQRSHLSYAFRKSGPNLFISLSVSAKMGTTGSPRTCESDFYVSLLVRCIQNYTAVPARSLLLNTSTRARPSTSHAVQSSGPCESAKARSYPRQRVRLEPRRLRGRHHAPTDYQPVIMLTVSPNFCRIYKLIGTPMKCRWHFHLFTRHFMPEKMWKLTLACSASSQVNASSRTQIERKILLKKSVHLTSITNSFKRHPLKIAVGMYLMIPWLTLHIGGSWITSNSPKKQVDSVQTWEQPIKTWNT